MAATVAHMPTLPRGPEERVALAVSSPDQPRTSLRMDRVARSSSPGRMRRIAGPLSLQGSPLAKCSSGPTTPVFLPPLASAPLPDTAAKDQTGHKRTASRAGLQQSTEGEQSSMRVDQEPDPKVKTEPQEPSLQPVATDKGEDLATSKRRRVFIGGSAPSQRQSASDPPASPTAHRGTRHILNKSLDSAALQSGVAARRGPAARSRNLLVSVSEHNVTPSGARSAPMRPNGFEYAQPGPALASAWPSYHQGAPDLRHSHHPGSFDARARADTQHYAHFATIPPTASRSHYPLPAEPEPAPKAAFLSLFSTFYDSLADSRVLSSNLDDQLRRSSALLASLQQSSTSVEAMIDRKLNNMSRDTTKELLLLEGRIERIESRLGLGPAILNKSANIGERMTRVEHAMSSVRDEPASA